MKNNKRIDIYPSTQTETFWADTVHESKIAFIVADFDWGDIKINCAQELSDRLMSPQEHHFPLYLFECSGEMYFTVNPSDPYFFGFTGAEPALVGYVFFEKEKQEQQGKAFEQVEAELRYLNIAFNGGVYEVWLIENRTIVDNAVCVGVDGIEKWLSGNHPDWIEQFNDNELIACAC